MNSSALRVLDSSSTTTMLAMGLSLLTACTPQIGPDRVCRLSSSATGGVLYKLWFLRVLLHRQLLRQGSILWCSHRLWPSLFQKRAHVCGLLYHDRGGKKERVSGNLS